MPNAAEVPDDWTWTEAVFHPEEGQWYIRLTAARHPKLVGQLMSLNDYAADQLQKALETGEPFHIDSFMCEGNRQDDRGLDIVTRLTITKTHTEGGVYGRITS